MIRRLAGWLVAMAHFGSLLTFSAPAAESRPNVILILSDDQGTLDLNCYGSKDLITPNLDALAGRGVRFTQFYAASPICSPARASLLTGRFPQRAGLPNMAPSQPGHPGMPADELTIAELLKAAGYRTALFGKWHLGTTPECSPNAQGFDDFFGHRSGCIDSYSHVFYWQGPPVHDLWRNTNEVWESGTHFSSLIVREANRFLEENRARPFFLYLPFNVPHYPLQSRDKFRERYAHLPETRRAYAAWVSDLDDSVGRILAKLDELKLREKTLIIFLSDQGHSTEERCNFGGGNAGPYRGAKFSLLEGGIRVPCIASFPGRLPEGQVREQLAASPDWFPTIAGLCGVSLPNRKLDGSSLESILQDAAAKTPHQTFFWQLGDQWAVRDGDWKLVVNASDTQVGKKLEGADRIFLSNLAIDATERHNIAGANPDIVGRLTGLHEQWASEVKTR